MGEQPIEQGAIGVASCRMHDKPTGLIDHQQVCVFIDNLQCHALRKPIALRLWLRRLHPDHLIQA
jgi:hypothetical protein